MSHQGILTPFELIDGKFIVVCVCKKSMSIELNNIRSLTNPHDSYFSDCFCFVGAKRKLKDGLAVVG